MLDGFLFIGLPYAAMALMAVGSIYRLHHQRFGVSALSSQMLEGKALRWSSWPWHAGILVVFLGHLLPLLFPGAWAWLVRDAGRLHAIEAAGMVAGLLAWLGLVIATGRRLLVPRVRAMSSFVDVAILLILLSQVTLGLLVAHGYRWGASWSLATVVPYLHGLVLLQPDAAFVADLPPVVRWHIVGAFVVAALVPFSRMVHMFSVPLQYLVRRPQRVVWSRARPDEISP